MDIKKEAVKCHEIWQGKIEINSRVKIEDRQSLSLAYTPGVAEPCLEIKDNPDLSYTYTRRHNLVAVISDGTAVLGLGDIGALAGMPVMEGKCALFKSFADIDAFPIVLNTKDADEIVRTVEILAPSFGGINLEDISAPRCFEIERRLKEKLDIPVFHDDQHGTAIVLGCALINSCRLTGRKPENMKCVICGAGAAGTAIAKLILQMGIGELIMVDKRGIICEDDESLEDDALIELSKITNRKHIKGALADAVVDADMFIGVSAGNLLSADMVKTMANEPIIFAMANPTPEIDPKLAKDSGAKIVGTGRSDYPNQINNVLAFPGVFKGALSVRAKQITEEMKMAAAKAMAELITDDELNEEYIIPDAFDKRVVEAVSKAVADTAIKQNIARI